MKKEKFNITGMTCSACSARVENCVNKLDGVSHASVNLIKNSMIAEYDDSKLNSNEIISAIKDAGYGASVSGKKDNSSQDSSNNAINFALNRLKLSSIFCIPLFYISMGYMYSWPLPRFITRHEGVMVFALIQLLLLIPILIINGRYFKNGYHNLIKLSPNMDTLIALGSSAATVYSLFFLFNMADALGSANMQLAHKYIHELYFEGAGTILTLISLGKFFEARAKGKTSEAIDKLMKLSPKTATIDINGVEKSVSIDELSVDDIIIIKAGESIACDGVVIFGNASVDESAISGESMPVDKIVGSNVLSGTINKSGYIKIRATHVAKDSTLAKIIQLVDDATSTKAPIAKLADKVSAIFVPIVMLIAILAFVVWLILGKSFDFAMTMGISVLVISCPCALGLATPTAVMVGTGRAAKEGILFKSAEALEHSAKCDTIILDKTGTITTGNPSVSKIESFINEHELLKIAASLENSSEHPLARAIIQKYNSNDYYDITNFTQYEGTGISAKINDKLYFAGNIRLIKNNNISIDLASINKPNVSSTAIYIADNNKLLGILYLSDQIKQNSKKAINELKTLGLNTIMLTGDNYETAHSIAQSINIDKFYAELLPQDKEKFVRDLQSKGKHVIMVGDGINDAPSLTRADIGIAIGAGTDIAIESANVVLMQNDLIDIPRAIKLSRLTLRIIKQNLFWAFIYNIIGIPIAAGILYNSLGLRMNPMFAAFAMSMSSLFVVSNALRLRFIGNTRYNKNTQNIKGESNTMKITLNVDGMACGHCVARVKQVLEQIDEVKCATPDLNKKNVTIELEKEISSDILIDAINNAGYKASK